MKEQMNFKLTLTDQDSNVISQYSILVIDKWPESDQVPDELIDENDLVVSLSEPYYHDAFTIEGRIIAAIMRIANKS